MEYEKPIKESDIFNPNYHQSNNDPTVLIDDTMTSELTNYVKKSGDTMGALSTSSINLYGTSSKIVFNDGSEMSSADTTTLTGLQSQITSNDNDINNNANNIFNNTSNIALNTNNIDINSSNISSNSASITDLKSINAILNNKLPDYVSDASISNMLTTATFIESTFRLHPIWIGEKQIFVSHGTSTVAYSYDGITWTNFVHTLGTFDTTGVVLLYIKKYDSVFYLTSGKLYKISLSDMQATTFTSSIVYTQTSMTNMIYSELTNTLVIERINGADSFPGIFFSTTNMVTFTGCTGSIDASSSFPWNNISYSKTQNIYVAMNVTQGTYRLIKSTDAISWDYAISSVNFRRDLVWAEHLDEFICVSQLNSTSSCRSANGINWTDFMTKGDLNLTSSNNLELICIPELELLMYSSVADPDECFISRDAVQWTKINVVVDAVNRKISSFAYSKHLRKCIFGVTSIGNYLGNLIMNNSNTIINVKDFGAKGDGIKDDASAIQYALNIGGSIYFPTGTYRINNCLNVYPNTHIYGDGMGKTIIKATSSSIAHIFVCQCQNISIKKMTLNGGDDMNGLTVGSAISILNSYDVYDSIFEDIRFFNTNEHGIHFSDSKIIKGIIINNCIFDNLGGGAVIMMKNTTSTQGIIMSNLIITDPMFYSDAYLYGLGEHVIDCAGTCILSNIKILFTTSANYISCVRFLVGSGKSTINNFCFKSSSRMHYGISVYDNNVNISNGTIVNMNMGISTGSFKNLKVTNVSMFDCNIGYNDNGIYNNYVNCSASNCDTIGFKLTSNTASLIGCSSDNNGTYGFFNNSGLKLSLIRCLANANTTANYNSFTGHEIINCMSDGVAISNNITLSTINGTAYPPPQIATNTTNIATNTANIATNTADIGTNTANIATNTANIATNATNIATNTANIATNTSTIASHTTSIATHTTNISTNTTNIATNTANIATNTADIATLTSVSMSHSVSTPTLSSDGGSGSVTYTTQACKYTVFSGYLWFTLTLTISSKSSLSGNIFVIPSLSYYPTTRTACTIGDLNVDNDVTFLTAVLDPSGKIYFPRLTGATSGGGYVYSTSGGYLQNNDIGNSFTIQVSGHFHYV